MSPVVNSAQRDDLSSFHPLLAGADLRLGVHTGTGLVGQLTRLAGANPMNDVQLTDGSVQIVVFSYSPDSDAERFMPAGAAATCGPLQHTIPLNKIRQSASQQPPVTINMTNANIFHSFQRITLIYFCILAVIFVCRLFYFGCFSF